MAVSEEEKVFIQERLGRLAQPAVTDDDLFLPRHDGKPLRLQSGFAFWPRGQSTKSATQGDVLATIGAVLQHLRTHRPPRGGGEPKLHHTAFHGALLARRRSAATMTA